MKLLLIGTIALMCCIYTIQQADGQIHPDDRQLKPLAAEEDVGPFQSFSEKEYQKYLDEQVLPPVWMG
uniref:Putative secreted protein n=1 Tax=Panstrongylus lignarius TaxID=156445 RepID=A0A224Y729_9HEMI